MALGLFGVTALDKQQVQEGCAVPALFLKGRDKPPLEGSPPSGSGGKASLSPETGAEVEGNLYNSSYFPYSSVTSHDSGLGAAVYAGMWTVPLHGAPMSVQKAPCFSAVNLSYINLILRPSWSP